ncbi:hypothetical protein Tco_0047469 [Tanacetum coccineum]
MASSCSSSNVTHTPVLDELFTVTGETEIPKSKSDKEAWTDSLDCFKDNKTRLEVKLSRLTQLEYENAEGVKELKVHSAIMELCEED